MSSAHVPRVDDEPMVVYQAEADGRIWVRPTDEFYDGRFEQLEPLATSADGWQASGAERDVIAERRRQVSVEGWSAEHDDQHAKGEMAAAAANYALNASDWRGQRVLSTWPWDYDWWKPKDRRRDLVRAAALIIAEIERLDRRAAQDIAMLT